MTETTKNGEVVREIASLTSDISETAASAFNPLYPASGPMVYRCVMRDGQVADVRAATGDEAALNALARHPGGFVTSINPAPKQ